VGLKLGTDWLNWPPLAALPGLRSRLFPGIRIENQDPVRAVLHAGRAEVEQIQNGSGNRIERLVADLAQLPVIFNEASDRTLIGNRVSDELFLRRKAVVPLPSQRREGWGTRSLVAS
jgi:hypothetical protein